MTTSEIIDEHRRLHSENERAFRRWLTTNAVIAALWLVAFIAMTATYSGLAAGQKVAVTVQAEAK
jgi:hypothetical protein